MRVLFDTTALCKRYIDEPGREQVLRVSALASEVVVAGHCKAEIASAINRRRHEGCVASGDYARIMAALHEDFSEFTRLELDGSVEAFSIAAMERMPLPASEALHIGAAQTARVDLFVTADARQARAAQAAGLKTELIEA